MAGRALATEHQSDRRGLPPEFGGIAVIAGTIALSQLLVSSDFYDTRLYGAVALLLLAAVVLAAFRGGVRAGMAAALLAVLYNIHLLSVPGQLFRLADAELRRAVILAIALPLVAFVVGYMRWRIERLLFRERALRLEAEAARARADAAAEHAAFLAEASRTLSGSLELESTLRRVAHLAIPAVADYCLIDSEGDDGELRRVATAHRDPVREAQFAQVQRRNAPDPARSPLARVLRTGEPLLIREITDEWLDQLARNDEHRRLIRDELGTRSLMTVPLATRGEVLGIVTFGATRDSGRLFDADDLSLAMQLADRAATAIDNARLLRRAEQAGAELQERVTHSEQLAEELQNQAAELEASQAELETANDDLQRSHAELAAAEAHYRRLVETSPYAVFVLNAQGVYTELNPAGERMLGRSFGEMTGLGFADVVAPEDLTGAQDVFQRVITGADAFAEVELWIERADGVRRLVHVAVTGISQDGAIAGVHGVVRDVTEERQAQEQLRESVLRDERLHATELERERLRTLFEQAPAFIAILEGPELVFRQVNRDYQQLIGPREVLGKAIREALPEVEGQGYFELLDQAYRTGEPQVGVGARVMLQRTPGGDLEECFVNFIYQPLRGPDGSVSGLFIHGVDVTDMVLARREAESANRAKNEFLGRMSHELRTPLNAILGFGQLLELEMERPENLESVTQILGAGRHLLILIDEVLDISRIESGQMSLSLEPVPLRSVLQESLDLVHLAAAREGIAIRAQDALSSEQFVRADQQRLKQVLLNLLSNAIKYNRRHGTVTIRVAIVGDRVCLSVIDTGFGIPAVKLHRLFTPFDRLDAERTAVEGTGLGLVLSRGLVDAMGGRMGVESTEGKGSRFWIELMMVERPPATDRHPPVRPAAAEIVPSTTTHTVLFIEDNLANVRLMKRLFERRPHIRLLTAMQGSLGVELAREHHPDVILLDMNLPDIGGDKVLLQVRNDPALRHTPVIMISGDATQSQVQRLLKLGANAYITKPFDIQELLRSIDEHLVREEG